MQIVDANVVLRYLLKDHERFFVKSKKIVEQNQIYIPTEVVTEIVYVLEKVYEVPRSEISEALIELLVAFQIWEFHRLEKATLLISLCFVWLYFSGSKRLS